MAMAGAIIGLVSTGLSMYGEYQKGEAAKNAGNYNAQVTENNKYFALLAQDRTAAQTQGKALASYGASGVRSDSGSPLDVLADSAGQAALDRLKTAYNYDSQAALDRMGASNATTSANINATSQLVRGAGQAYSQVNWGGTKVPGYSSDFGSDSGTQYAGGTDLG